ncbi:hypothetical protein NESM_000583900 [Novymonas esmeraldas]|uniref:Uncharacterized protein n=1 Tax=Novymonas esmeraldas TaxID=1808958 RepID=A0AAW0ERX4_9TRYP
MPPKRRLPRRGKAQSGELNLDAVSEERIDAVTAEPLDASKFIEVLSPDRTLRLFYNTSTLIRIAVDNGGFMQPPHFREPMANALRRRIEEIEGKKFHFESHNTVAHGDEQGDGSGVAVLHRHVYFEQIMEEFYLLNPAELYVCPVCYEHYLRTRYLPELTDDRRAVKYLQSGRPVVDPLDVISHMHGDSARASETDDGAAIVLNPVWDNALAHIVFRRAAHWKAHMETHHEVRGVSVSDYRLRDVLCTYFNDYNQWNEERYEAEARQHGGGKKKASLTLQRYWHINASYNRLRYNRIVAAAELAEGHPEAVTTTAFPEETIAHHFNPENEDEDDFIDDEDTDADDYVAPYSPGHEGFDDEEEDDADSSEVEPAPRRREGHKRQRSVETDSVSSDTESSSATATSSDSDYNAEVEKQQALFKRGLLAERDCYYSRLSAEDRRFFEKSQRANVAPSQLYDPRMHQKGMPASTVDEDIDWENIGETLPLKSPVRAKLEAPPPSHCAPANGVPIGTTLLLDEDEAPPADICRTQASPNARASRLLLDED